MKVVYNSKEIADNQNNYNRLTEKPLINSVELVGNITLNDINVYSKEEVKKLISSARSVKVAAVQPSPLAPNTTYYIGPDTNGIYEVYLTDSSGPINYFKIGTTNFGRYYSGEGVNVDPTTRNVSVLVDSESVIINSEGLLQAITIFDKVEPFRGATSTRAGTKGIVPTPRAGDQDKFLKGDGTWAEGGGGYSLALINKYRPVGSIYLTYNNTYNPNTLFPGTTWELMESGRTLQTDSEGGSIWSKTIDGVTVECGMPNVYGDLNNTTSSNKFNLYITGTLDPSLPEVVSPNSPYFYTKNSTTIKYFTGSSSGISESQTIPTMNTEYWTNGNYNVHKSDVYTKDYPTVRPASIKICMWRRTA